MVFIVDMSELQQGCMGLDDGHPTMNICHTAGESGDQAQVWHSLLQETCDVLFLDEHEHNDLIRLFLIIIAFVLNFTNNINLPWKTFQWVITLVTEI